MSGFEREVGTDQSTFADAFSALSLMTSALQQLDGNPAIPAIIGARLQHAIDCLCAEYNLDSAVPSSH